MKMDYWCFVAGGQEKNNTIHSAYVPWMVSDGKFGRNITREPTYASVSGHAPA